jgi:hypothetical protein
MATIEYVSGQESHTSNWGKMYVKGLEKLVVREEHEKNVRDRHHQYQCYMGEAPTGTVFTIFYQDGNKRGTETWDYQICVADDDATEQEIKYGYTGTFVAGRFRVIAKASGKVKAPRLMGWWDARPQGIEPVAFAEHCAAHIDRRGVAVLPAMV